MEDQTYRPSEGVTDINTYVYDKNGNQLRKYSSQSKDVNVETSIAIQAFQGNDFNVEINTYNTFNQLTSYQNSDGTTASYTYLANGLRDSKTVDGTTTYFLWNGTNILADFDSSSNFTNVYSRGLQLIKNDSNTYYTFNGHGDVTSLTNNSGTVTKSYDYDAFGVEIGKNDNDTNPWHYCGEYYDNETDTIYLRARYYSPTTGRFTTEDPIRDELNWYAYCTDNPIAFIDPSGLSLVYLTGTDEENKVVMEAVQDLTSDDIYMRTDEYGQTYLTCTERTRVAEDREVGTALVRKIFNANADTYIDVTSDDLSIGGVGARDANGKILYYRITLNIYTEHNYEVYNEATGKAESFVTPNCITLAHEFIHVYNRMSRRGLDANTYKVKYAFINSYSQKIQYRYAEIEELRVAGISVYDEYGRQPKNNDYFTENNIRGSKDILIELNINFSKLAQI